MAGRTVAKWTRVYIDGLDMSGYARSIGPLAQTFDEAEGVAFLDGVKGVLPNHAKVAVGTLNAVFDNTSATGPHALLSSPAKRVVSVALGMRAEPAAGDAVFSGEFLQKDYMAETSDGMATISAPFENFASDASSLLYALPWGVLLHARGAETGANTAIGIDDWGAQTTKGGVFFYHLLTSNGTVTLKVQDAAVNSNPSFGDLAGATSGVIDASASPKSGMVAIGNTATVRRYLRWQLVFGTATTATFVQVFNRAV